MIMLGMWGMGSCFPVLCALNKAELRPCHAKGIAPDTRPRQSSGQQNKCKAGNPKASHSMQVAQEYALALA